MFKTTSHLIWPKVMDEVLLRHLWMLEGLCEVSNSGCLHSYCIGPPDWKTEWVPLLWMQIFFFLICRKSKEAHWLSTATLLSEDVGTSLVSSPSFPVLAGITQVLPDHFEHFAVLCPCPQKVTPAEGRSLVLHLTWVLSSCKSSVPVWDQSLHNLTSLN